MSNWTMGWGSGGGWDLGHTSQILGQLSLRSFESSQARCHRGSRYLSKAKKRHCSWSWAFDNQASSVATHLQSSQAPAQQCRHTDLLAVPQALRAPSSGGRAHADATFRHLSPATARALPADPLRVPQDWLRQQAQQNVLPKHLCLR